MNVSKDSQGYIGDVASKSISELKEILARKEKFLTNRSLLQTLPDKGEKVRDFIQEVKQLIETKSKESSTSNDVFEKQRTLANSRLNVPIAHQAVSDTSGKMSTHKSITERLDKETDIRVDSSPKDPFHSAEIIASSLQSLSLDSSGQQSQPTQVNDGDNMYSKILEHDRELLTKETEKFMPSRLPKSDNPKSAQQKSQHRKTRSHEKEESAVHPPQYKYQQTKLISLAESIQLTMEQKTRSEELAIERATKRLIGQTWSTMDTYNPPSVDMNYRQPNDDPQELDSDDDLD